MMKWNPFTITLLGSILYWIISYIILFAYPFEGSDSFSFIIKAFTLYPYLVLLSNLIMIIFYKDWFKKYKILSILFLLLLLFSITF